MDRDFLPESELAGEEGMEERTKDLATLLEVHRTRSTIHYLDRDYKAAVEDYRAALLIAPASEPSRWRSSRNISATSAGSTCSYEFMPAARVCLPLLRT